MMDVGRGSRRGSWVYLLSTILILLLAVNQIVPPTSGQISACTTAMIASLMPCASFLTGSGGSSPVASCCKAVGDLVGSSRDCSCMLFTRTVPFGSALGSAFGSTLPINRTLALQLPSICGTSSVPLLECNSSSISGRIPLPPLGSILPPPPPQKPVREAPPPATDGGLKPFVLPSGAVILHHHNSALSLVLLLVPPLITLLWTTP